MSTPNILTQEIIGSPAGDRERIAAELINITQAGATPLDGFLTMLHSASSERAAEIGREQIETHYHRLLTAALSGHLAPQRAALVFALVAGVQVMRQVISPSALADADPADLISLLALFQHLVTEPPGAPPSPG